MNAMRKVPWHAQKEGHMAAAPEWQLLADDKAHVRSCLCSHESQYRTIRQASAAFRALQPLSLHGKADKGPAAKRRNSYLCEGKNFLSANSNYVPEPQISPLKARGSF
jgi:hypothetical protein